MSDLKLKLFILQDAEFTIETLIKAHRHCVKNKSWFDAEDVMIVDALYRAGLVHRSADPNSTMIRTHSDTKEFFVDLVERATLDECHPINLTDDEMNEYQNTKKAHAMGIALAEAHEIRKEARANAQRLAAKGNS